MPKPDNKYIMQRAALPPAAGVDGNHTHSAQRDESRKKMPYMCHATIHTRAALHSVQRDESRKKMLYMCHATIQRAA